MYFSKKRHLNVRSSEMKNANFETGVTILSSSGGEVAKTAGESYYSQTAIAYHASHLSEYNLSKKSGKTVV